MKLTNTTKIGISWTIITVVGLYGFYLSKKSIDKSRYELMQVRERIKQANAVDYEKSTRKFN